jgi:hypothetical protein
MSTINFNILTSVPDGPRKEEVVEQKESNSGQHSKELNAAPFPEKKIFFNLFYLTSCNTKIFLSQV